MGRNPYESMIDWFARNSVAANLLMVILLVGGLFAAFTITAERRARQLNAQELTNTAWAFATMS